MESGPPPPPPPSTSPSPPPAPSGAERPEPTDVNSTQGAHFRRLAKKPVTLILGSIGVIGGFAFGTVGGGVLLGVAVAAGMTLVALLVVFVYADSAAEEDFFEQYASARGLSRTAGPTTMPESTPLLRKGDRRYGEQKMNGTLPGGAVGEIALYAYEVDRRQVDGDRKTVTYQYTVVLHDVPSVTAKVTDVNCQRRRGFRALDDAEDTFRKKMQRLELESEALDKNFEIFYGANDDQLWMKQLFSPSFIVWMTENTPEKFAWELSTGSLCCYVRGHVNDAAELDAICETAAAVAARLAAEAGE